MEKIIMDKMEKNTSSVIIFILVIIAIGFGGYYFIKNYQKANTNNKEYINTSDKNQIIKIDESKDYVYFTNEAKIGDSLDVTYKDINFNINNDDLSKLQETLNANMDKIRNSVVKLDLTAKEECLSAGTCDESDDISSANVIEYNVVETSKYLSLTVSTYLYTLANGNPDKANSYYVIDLSNGKLLSNNDILKKEDVTDQEVRTKIRSYLANDTDVDIDAVLNNPYYLTIAKDGKVVINFVVKTSSINYNVSIEME